MLFAASESAVTKNPRLRFTIRRSSSVNPFGSFQSAISRLMLTSWGIQWFAHAARYFSHAHLYLNGTSWLTSVRPLMIRLSSSRIRRWSPLGLAGSDDCSRAPGAGAVVPVGTKPAIPGMPNAEIECIASVPTAVTSSSNCNILLLRLLLGLLLASLAFWVVDRAELGFR